MNEFRKPSYEAANRLVTRATQDGHVGYCLANSNLVSEIFQHEAEKSCSQKSTRESLTQWNNSRKIDANDSPVCFLLSWLTKFSRFFFIMAEAHTCLNLANFHVVVWWSKHGSAYVAKELLSLDEMIMKLKYIIKLG